MEERHLNILHEDNHVLAIAKPANLLVQGDRTGDPTLRELAQAYLKQRYGKPGNVYLGLVHRLDRPVSGVVLLARTSKAASRLAHQFREGDVSKQYMAVVQGVPNLPGDELVHHLAGSGDERMVTRASLNAFPGSKIARLRYLVTSRSIDRALLEIELLTGRRHQIRAQLALAGWPVVGDVKYGARPEPRYSGIALHARRLEFAHPVGGAPIRVEAPLPTGWPWPADEDES
jgi:23S rRNA pseudouridine1911/1915/1917 synthase